MQIKPEQLAAALRQGLRSLYVVTGDEPLLVQEAADAVRAAARAAGHSERHVHTVSGAHFDWGAVIASTQAMSLFADKQIVEIRIPSGKPGKDGSVALQQIAESMAQAAGDVVVIVHLPRLDGQQSKSAWMAALDAAGAVVRIEPVARNQLQTWLAKRLAAQQQRVADGEEGERTLAFIADRVEGNLLAAHQEISKLALLYPDAKLLSYEQVEAAVLNVARYDVAKLTEAIFAGQVERTLRILDGLQAEGEPPVFVHWTLAEDIRTLKRLRDAMNRGTPLPMAMNEARVWGVKQRLFERVAPHFSEHQLAHLVDAASTCDGIVKGLRDDDWPPEPWDALRRLVLMLLDCTAAAPTGTRAPRGAVLRLAIHA